MKKYIKIFLIVFMMFVLNILCFSAQPKKISRQKAIQYVASLMDNCPRIKYLCFQKCANCNNYTAEHGFYYVTSDGTFKNSVIYFYAYCKNCDYLEVGYRGDDKTNYGGYLYQGTK